MNKPKNNYYVVWKGHQAGIFNSWEECKKQVDGCFDAKYKGFLTLEEAKTAFAGNASDYYGKAEKPSLSPELRKLFGEPERDALCVDAACSGNPGVLEYRGVDLVTGKEVFRRGPFNLGTTNIGEFLAIVTGLAWLQKNGLTMPIYSDSRNGIIWTKQKRINTKLQRNSQTEALFVLLDRAILWLHNNSFDNRLLKWNTEAWGEIPADFGRK